MLEFIFYHTGPLEIFLDYLEQEHVRHEVDIQQDTMKVFIPDNIDEDLANHIEAQYRRLLEMNQQLTDQPDTEADEASKVAIDITRKDGTLSTAFIEPEMMNRLMSVPSHEEFGTLTRNSAHWSRSSPTPSRTPITRPEPGAGQSPDSLHRAPGPDLLNRA